MLERNWDEAYAACLANPIKGRRAQGFRRLVLGMSDAGALHELIEMPLTVVGKPKDPKEDVTMAVADEDADFNKSSSFDELDLYELAAETLADAASEQSRSSSIRGATDYRGCLYSLHASRANWRRAGAAMAFGGTLAMSRAAVSSLEESKEDTRAIIDGIALAALGAAHSIRLEESPSHRFIVENEVGQYPAPPLFREGMDEASAFVSNNKRNRDGQRQHPLFGQGQAQGSSTTTANRSTRLMLEKDLIAQAIQRVGLRTLLLDQSKSEAGILAALQANSRDIVEQLASQGYYSLALGFAKTLHDERDDARPKGRDFFADAVAYIAIKYLAPRAVKHIFPSPLTSEEERDDEMIRPTLFHIHSSAENVDSTYRAAPAGGSEGWKSQEMLLKSAHVAACMDLLCCYTTKYANSTNNLAIEVATALLDLDDGMATLPIWLTDLLCGCSSGCFAGSSLAEEKSTSNAANPTALVKLYMNRGLFAEACNVVANVLEKSGIRAGSSAARMPEEGSIDFVPYATIDQLWNIIDSAESMNEDEKARLLQARANMEAALENHMKRVRIGEEGLKSARALKM